MSSSASLPPALRAQSLLVRRWAGDGNTQLEIEWACLMNDHGHVLEVALTRFDLLLDVENYGEAKTLLERLPGRCQEEPAVRSRRVRLLLALTQWDAVVSELRAAWRTPHCETELPSQMLETFSRVGVLRPLADAMLEDLEADVPVSFASVRSLAYGLATHEMPMQLDRLAALTAQRSGASEHRLLSFIFDAMCGVGRVEPILSWCREHPVLARENTELWQAVGYALHRSERFDEVETWFDGWRERSGLEMWAVSSYLVSLQQQQRWAQCRDEARWAVAHVPPDHSRPSLLLRLIDTDLHIGRVSAAGDFSDFVEDYGRFGSMLPADDLDDALGEVYRVLYDLLSATDSSQLVAVAAELRALVRTHDLGRDWRVRIARQIVSRRLSWWDRLWTVRRRTRGERVRSVRV